MNEMDSDIQGYELSIGQDSVQCSDIRFYGF